MGYIDQNLLPSEKKLYFGRVHPVIFLPVIMMMIFTMFFFSLLLSTGTHSSSTTLNQSNDVINAVIATIYFFLTIGSAIGILFALLMAIIITKTDEFAITNKRVIEKTGFIKRQTHEIFLDRIESVEVNQGILGRLLNFGTVTINGTGGTTASFRTIKDPVALSRKINQIINHFSSTGKQD